ncbi:hypothetical protein BY996DRAFT_6544062 [Phakopsora pachyrhizi]|uniref:Uncharacterized protein n=1 Tax=Phakopsora pachyrhizi TaxID=170000 RepID=A0AAV0AM61_PHAPC|nr:hypothetical protein BY996DRAFT_6544062 [Phakopsora pachyrhizi]CAH7669115.1 hypothetical protein PPACK8108_LOCUS3685 [Phakopsora pachyrhizi]
MSPTATVALEDGFGGGVCKLDQLGANLRLRKGRMSVLKQSRINELFKRGIALPAFIGMMKLSRLILEAMQAKPWKGKKNDWIGEGGIELFEKISIREEAQQLSCRWGRNYIDEGLRWLAWNQRCKNSWRHPNHVKVGTGVKKGKAAEVVRKVQGQKGAGVF